jgi:hypothetical protein
VAEDENDEGAIRAPGGYYYFGAAKNLPGVRELLKPKSMRLDSTFFCVAFLVLS